MAEPGSENLKPLVEGLGERPDRAEAVVPRGPSSTAVLGSTEVEAETALIMASEANTCIGGMVHAIGQVDDAGLR
jgi:hypothetical protein